jgi:DNA-binding transcriptional ArsR family regulator
MVRRKSVYKKALRNKQIAAQILIPLIEFEFGFLGNDSPDLIQSPVNKEQFEAIYEICEKHDWILPKSNKKKGKNLYFRMSKKGFKEVYDLAGPFSNSYKNRWAILLLERYGVIGGYQINKRKTHDRVLEVLDNHQWKTLQSLCLELRLTPGTVREGIRNLKKMNLITRKMEGKSAYYKMKGMFCPSTSPGARAG